jgi:hypothetical protein
MMVVTSLTFKKGGAEDMWTVGGLPQEIEVNMTIKDLYPTLMMTKSYKVLSVNTGMVTWLENIAGLSINELKILDNLFNALQQRINKIALIPEGIQNSVNSKLAEAVRVINNIFR